MPYLDLHEKPFDEATKAKLQIFEEYATAWLPTFIMSGSELICVFDFFSGTGYDKDNVPGSPIRTLTSIKQFVEHARQKGTRIAVYFNEFDKKKFEILKQACNEYLETNPILNDVVQINYENLEFDTCFDKWLPLINSFPSLVYLDQNGVKFLSDKYFLSLERTTKTDFLYFVSSSYFIRFGQSEEFRKHIDLDMEEVKKAPHTFIHKILITHLWKKIPKNSELKIYPFSLKKGNNIHGIIFAAKSPRAVEKFLNIAWRMNPINGDANFDIDNDITKGQLDFFEGKKKTKIEDFQQMLEEKIRGRQSISNADVFLFTLSKGHPPKHATEHLRNLKRERKIYYDGMSPKVTYASLFDLKDRVEIQNVGL